MWPVGEQEDWERRAERPTGTEEAVGSVPASLGAVTARSAARGRVARGVSRAAQLRAAPAPSAWVRGA